MGYRFSLLILIAEYALNSKYDTPQCATVVDIKTAEWCSRYSRTQLCTKRTIFKNEQDSIVSKICR